jgi:hypothetical protein
VQVRDFGDALLEGWDKLYSRHPTATVSFSVIFLALPVFAVIFACVRRARRGGKEKKRN